MIITSQGFIDKANNPNRKPQYKVSIDWEFKNLFEDESVDTLEIEIERAQNEPFGGVTLAQADVTLFNTDNKFTPQE